MFKVNYVLIVLLGILVISACKKPGVIQQKPASSKLESVKNITVFVHGTHTEFLTKLLKPVLFVPNKLVLANDLNSSCYVKWFAQKVSGADPEIYPIDSFYAIGWSGALSSQERLKAAQNLYRELSTLVSDLRSKNINPRITVIGHSHGGNVALNLSKFYNNFKINKLVLLATPIQEETEKYIESDMFEKVYSIYSRADLVQIIDPQGLQTAKESFFSHRRFGACPKLKQVKIKLNSRAIFHKEFIFYSFPRVLPALLNAMDKISCTDKEQLIKIEFKRNQVKNIEIK